MKLDTRRTIRRWLLDLPDRTLLATGVGFAGLLILGGVTETDVLFGIGLFGLLGVIYIKGNVRFDACPNCRYKIDATEDRYCPTCGARLDEIEAAPPINERVEERFRPVGLEEIERSPDVEAIADGGNFDEPEESGEER